MLQQRDHHLLHALFTHRYLTVKHIHSLVFASRSRRRAQDRLRLLWQGGFLERTRIVREDWRHPSKPPPSEFLYALAKRGAMILAETLGEDLGNIPHTPAQNAHGFATLQHHIVVTDFMVSLQVALNDGKQQDVSLVKVEREHTLRKLLGAHALNHEVKRPWLVPDGSFTLQVPELSKPVTFYLEVVRSLPVGGRNAFFEKLSNYVDALREERFQQIWKHPHVAAVLILTPTLERAERLRVQAEQLPRHADRFWFASYLTGTTQEGKHNALVPETIFTPHWHDGLGAPRSLSKPISS